MTHESTIDFMTDSDVYAVEEESGSQSFAEELMAPFTFIDAQTNTPLEKEDLTTDEVVIEVGTILYRGEGKKNDTHYRVVSIVDSIADSGEPANESMEGPAVQQHQKRDDDKLQAASYSNTGQDDELLEHEEQNPQFAYVVTVTPELWKLVVLGALLTGGWFLVDFLFRFF